MDCQSIAKNLKLNKTKRIGNVIIIVEGEVEEYHLLKRIFTKVFDYDYVSLGKETVREEFISKTNQNSRVIIARTNSSNIESIREEEYIDNVHKTLQKELGYSITNSRIYFIWDRDNKSNVGKINELLGRYSNAQENDYNMNGLLLLSYPCIEVYELSHFHKRYHLKEYALSNDVKVEKGSDKRYSLNKITDTSMLLAVENMHRGLLDFDIKQYDMDDFSRTSLNVYDKEEKMYDDVNKYKALSLVSIMLIDLGLIEKR